MYNSVPLSLPVIETIALYRGFKAGRFFVFNQSRFTVRLSSCHYSSISRRSENTLSRESAHEPVADRSHHSRVSESGVETEAVPSSGLQRQIGVPRKIGR